MMYITTLPIKMIIIMMGVALIVKQSFTIYYIASNTAS